MDFKKPIAYQKAFDLAMSVFEISKSFPKEGTYSLTDQIRRSSRSLNANLAEAYRKREYPKQYDGKLTDADAENSETNTSLDFALACNYISKEQHIDLSNRGIVVGKLINFMINNPGKFEVNTD
ncbi:MAG: diversity-generating retroelement protein bAvd family protein [Xanthomarina sp.]|uniref:Diversity-generating retroelement protein bAvd family protein n=1 Tax=Xanthomarina gelatinilytica TaxID=1137281 RepID=A0A3C0F104_9FLAO|nr:four helix bundle protein [Xanthomarina sp.]HAB27194.1 diversity-generating retroelement protein bAvd family protein [Xanthomarina gelatinilytica]MAL22109.1 diversity-generating retroelement protein bAvd family protein [Xanthomarina sp.]MBF61343.1 diversity-generating retroelement protein bAvd family protein [Xanthomarina sp.]HAI17110.1 diversity-generating retroelement protein bAvd family protein [Xanthomarina gelatinilytica]HCY82149.1 diversity-generating retroelement protein bAvd family |tara:strand:- start:20 stop:391 length:372 start_codon:yes stop_codon:yes gene_type:complete